MPTLFRRHFMRHYISFFILFFADFHAMMHYFAAEYFRRHYIICRFRRRDYYHYYHADSFMLITFAAPLSFHAADARHAAAMLSHALFSIRRAIFTPIILRDAFIRERRYRMPIIECHFFEMR